MKTNFRDFIENLDIQLDKENVEQIILAMENIHVITLYNMMI